MMISVLFSLVLGGVAAAAHRSKYESRPGYRPVQTMGAFAVAFSLAIAVIHLVGVSRSAGPSPAAQAAVATVVAPVSALAGLSSVPTPAW